MPMQGETAAELEARLRAEWEREQQSAPKRPYPGMTREEEREALAPHIRAMITPRAPIEAPSSPPVDSGVDTGTTSTTGAPPPAKAPGFKRVQDMTPAEQSAAAAALGIKP